MVGYFGQNGIAGICVYIAEDYRIYTRIGRSLRQIIREVVCLVSGITLCQYPYG